MKTKKEPTAETWNVLCNLSDSQHCVAEGHTKASLHQEKKELMFRLYCYLVYTVAIALVYVGVMVVFSKREDAFVAFLLAVTTFALPLVGVLHWSWNSLDHPWLKRIHKMKDDYQAVWAHNGAEWSTTEKFVGYLDQATRNITKRVIEFERIRTRDKSKMSAKEKKDRKLLKHLVGLTAFLQLMGTKDIDIIKARRESHVKGHDDNVRASCLYAWLFRNPDFKV